MSAAAPSPVMLVFGPHGQIGWELVRSLSPVGRVVAAGRPAVDFLRPETVRNVVREVRPSVIWNAAADTSVDAIEAHEAVARQVNAEAPGVLADEARRLGATLIHFSTDYVFDGAKRGRYAEDDQPNPLNAYGRTKLAGEQNIRDVGGQFLIVRTSWIYSGRRQNFVQSMVSLGGTAERLRVVDDQWGAPTWARHVAQACVTIARRLVEPGEGEMERPSGLYHLTAEGSTSWFGFATAIRDALVARGRPWRAVLEPVSTAEYKAPASRPRNSVLSNEKVNQLLGIALPDWSEALLMLLNGQAG